MAFQLCNRSSMSRSQDGIARKRRAPCKAQKIQVTLTSSSSSSSLSISGERNPGNGKPSVCFLRYDRITVLHVHVRLHDIYAGVLCTIYLVRLSGLWVSFHSRGTKGKVRFRRCSQDCKEEFVMLTGEKCSGRYGRTFFPAAAHDCLE